LQDRAALRALLNVPNLRKKRTGIAGTALHLGPGTARAVKSCHPADDAPAQFGA
jgi:hypothetical protein